MHAAERACHAWTTGRARLDCVSVASWDDVRAIALSLPGASERDARGRAQWRVSERLFVWERPLRPAEAAELGKDAPDGPILGARVEHLGAKEALLGDEPGVFFTTSHFKGYPAVLVRLERIELEELCEVVIEAWLARAGKRLVAEYLQAHPPEAGGAL
jgi:hypothetical protein